MLRMPSSPIERAPRKRRLLRWAVAASAVVFPLPALLIAARSYRAEKALFFPARAPLRVSAAEAGLRDLQSVELGGPHKVRGWYVPPKNGAAVVLLHGAGGDRAQLLVEARVLADQGFGVLSIDWPGHGESDGEVTWAEGERAALRSALDWLAGRPGVEHIGAYGFSMGGYILAQVAAADARVRAVVLAGTPARVIDQSAWQFGSWGFVSRLPARWALRRGGLRFEDPQPREAVAALAPRPLLVVQGTSDVTVPPFMAEAIHAAAREPRELYLVEGAPHGNYHQAAPGYGTRLVAFFQRALR